MDETTIKVAVDSSQVGAASKTLDEFSAAGNKATATTERLSAAAAKQQGIFEKFSGSGRKNVLSFKDADSAIASLGLTGAAADKVRAQLGDLGKTQVDGGKLANTFGQIGQALDQVSFKSSTARREILVLLSELARGDFHRFGASLLVLAEYTNLSTFATSALGIGLGAVVVALGGLAIAAIKGSQEMHELNNALLLTNNYAGLTADSFGEMATKIAKNNNLPIGNVREMGLELARTGEIAPQVFSAAWEATTKFAELTGQEADKVAAHFAKMSASPTKFLIELNQTTHAFTAAQYEQVRALEDAGRGADAQGVIYDALNQRLSGLNQDLGFLGQRLRFLKTDWQEFWNAANNLGRPETIGDKVNKARAAVENNSSFLTNPIGSIGQALGFNGRGEQLQSTLSDLQREQFRKGENAFGSSLRDQAQSAGIQARKWGDDLLKAAKDTQSLSKALKDAEVEFKKAEESGTPFTNTQKNEIREVIRRRNTRRGGGNEAQQVSRATLSQQLEIAAKALKDEQESITFSEKYIEAVFQRGNISVDEYYAERSRLIRAGVDAELAEIDKERSLIDQALNNKKSPLFEADPSTRVNLQTKRNKLDQQASDIRRKASQQEVLDNEKSGLTYLQLQERVEAYNIQLLQSAGLEEQAARLRTSRLLQQASVLAGETRGTPFALDITALKQQLETQDRLNELKRESSILDTARGIEEENISRLVTNGSITELQSFQALSQARALAIPQLEAIVKEQEKLAELNPQNLQIRLDASKARLELEKLKDSLDPLAEKFRNAFKDQTGNFLFDLMTGKAKPKDAIKTLFNGIGETISRQVADNFSSQLFGKDGAFGGLGDFVSKNLFGTKKPEIDTSGVQSSLTAIQTSGLQPATAALQLFTAALQTATNAVTPSSAAAQPTLTTGDFSRLDRGQTENQDVIKNQDQLADTSKTASDANLKAASSALVLASSASKGGSALSLLPQIIAAIQAAGVGGSGGAGGLIGSLLGSFTGSSAAGAGAGAGATFSPEVGALFGWASGGYTGDKAPNKVAGVVHGREFVFSAPAVKAIGRNTLEAMHEKASQGSNMASILIKNLHSPGYMDGGYVEDGTWDWSKGQMPSGNREYGGPVTSGSMYRVNERGPEVLSVGGKQYLMTGSKGGEVWPSSNGGKSGDQHIHVSVTPPPGGSRQTAMQWGAEAGRHIAQSMRRNGK